MIYNFWTLSFISFIIITTCYCGKKEFFEEPEKYEWDGSVKNDDNGERYVEYNDKTEKILSQVDSGTKYTIEDVNKATIAIIEYFGEKYNVNISITKVISIKNSPGQMNLTLFLYDPIKNTIIGYNIDVIMPLTKNKAASIKTIEKFSKKEQISEKIDFNSYSNINFNEGNFT